MKIRWVLTNVNVTCLTTLKDDRIRSKQHLSTRIDDVPNAPTGKIPLEELSRCESQ